MLLIGALAIMHRMPAWFRTPRKNGQDLAGGYQLDLAPFC